MQRERMMTPAPVYYEPSDRPAVPSYTVYSCADDPDKLLRRALGGDPNVLLITAKVGDRTRLAKRLGVL